MTIKELTQLVRLLIDSMKASAPLLAVLATLAVPFIYQYFKNKKEDDLIKIKRKLVQKTILDFFEYNNILGAKSKLTSSSQFGSNFYKFNDWLINTQKNTTDLKTYELTGLALSVYPLLKGTIKSKYNVNNLSPKNLRTIYLAYDEISKNVYNNRNNIGKQLEDETLNEHAARIKMIIKKLQIIQFFTNIMIRSIPIIVIISFNNSALTVVMH
jgi:hypothetical protein